MRFPKLKVEKLVHGLGDEMYGFRTGRNKFRKYFRLDLGRRSYRITKG